MSKALDSIGTTFSGINVDGTAECISDLVSSIARPFDFHDNGVNHRPAAQQWAVCTP